ncbi:MAG TPA: ribosome maturation factor RimP [Stellaceae bacterium]|nr:ribosome maturation factor RimP [Stellaceae bacterium]
MFDAGKIESMIGPSLAAMGYSIVRVAFTGGRSRPTLQIMAERQADGTMTVEDCETVSHTVSALLDVADPIASSYVLEVSSPGIDRPLTRRADYERFAGFEAKIEMQRPVDGRRRFRGKLMGLEGDDAKLMVGADTLRLPLDAIARAKLVLTDELIAATQPQHHS